MKITVFLFTFYLSFSSAFGAQHFIDNQMQFLHCNVKGNPVYLDTPSGVEFEMIDTSCVKKASPGDSCLFGGGFTLTLKYFDWDSQEEVWSDSISGLEFTVDNPCLELKESKIKNP